MVLFFSLFINQMSFAEMSLNDLGFKSEDLKVNPEITKIMEVRQSKLQIHQKMGLATMGIMTATLLAAETAKDNDLHKYLGIASGLMYWSTAYFSLSAPEVEGGKETGSSKIHKSLAWIHAPLMAIVPILGYLNKKDHDNGKEPTGIKKAHGGLATAAYASFMAAGLSMYFDFSF
jgi:hypothetical protein